MELQVQLPDMPSWLSSLLLAVPAVLQASAGQVPIVDGVIGGVATQNNVVPETTSAKAPFAGELRVVENSGICGPSLFRFLLQEKWLNSA